MANLRTNNLSGEQGQNAYRGSVFFNGGSDSLVIPASSDFAYGTGDFTIEAWIWKDPRPATGQTRGIFTQTQSGNDYIVFKIGSTNVIEATFGSTTISTSDKLAVDSWNHVAVSRSSNTIKVFLNGIASSGSTVSTDFSDTTRNPTIGNYTHSYGTIPYFGYISNLRVTKGEALYTADFTPPTSELTADANTVLLCCQDSDDPLQEATGKTITGKGIHEYLNDDEVVLNGTFDTDTSDWTTQGDTVEIDNQRLKIIRTGTFGAATQQLNTRMTTGTQYKFRGRIEQSGSPGSALIRLSSASNGNGTVFFNGAYGTGLHEHIFTYSSGGGFYVSAITGNGNVTGIFDDISVKAINTGTPPKNIPPFGVDAGNTFGGPIQQSTQGYMYFPTGRTEERGRGRALFAGGYAVPQAAAIKDIYYSQIESTGTITQFGELSVARWIPSSGASSTRGVFNGGGTPSRVDTIDFVTIATTSNATDFGDLNTQRTYHAGFSNSIRAISGGGNDGSSIINSIEFMTIANTGDASDFGDLTTTTQEVVGDCSPTRGLFMGGVTPSRVNTVEFITIASTGNASDFGDLTTGTSGGAALSSNTRALYGGGESPTYTNTIEFFTIASAGNATDFGDLITAVQSVYGGTSNNIRGVFVAGYKSPGSNVNSIEHVTIATTGNASDFGDLVYRTRGITATSDSHGGLS